MPVLIKHKLKSGREIIAELIAHTDYSVDVTVYHAGETIPSIEEIIEAHTWRDGLFDSIREFQMTIARELQRTHEFALRE